MNFGVWKSAPVGFGQWRIRMVQFCAAAGFRLWINPLAQRARHWFCLAALGRLANTSSWI